MESVAATRGVEMRRSSRRMKRRSSRMKWRRMKMKMIWQLEVGSGVPIALVRVANGGMNVRFFRKITLLVP